jgi:uncharacterized protein (UPF0332 family)
VSPEAVDYLGTAERALDVARRSLAAEIYEAAARESYIAALNAARAVIFDLTQIAPKSPSGTRSQFFLLIEQGLEFDRRLAGFLARGFDIKQKLDYGPWVDVDAGDAQNCLEQAESFVAAARAVCEAGSAGQSRN